MVEVEIEGAGGARFVVTPGLDAGYVEHFEQQKAAGDVREVKLAPVRKPKPTPKAD